MLQVRGRCPLLKVIVPSYTETIDLCYRTNTIHINNDILARYLHLLLVPQRLANITSFELVWDIPNADLFAETYAVPDKAWPNYNELMTTISTKLPSLTRLYISVMVTSYIIDFENAIVEAYERWLLEPADALMRDQGSKLTDFQMAPSLSLHEALMQRAEKAGARIERGGIGVGSWKRFWRPVIMHGDSQSTNDLGYWVRQGKDDTPPWYWHWRNGLERSVDR